MPSPLLPSQKNRLGLNQKIIQLCRDYIRKLYKQGDYKHTKTFFVSQANHFIENLIHLHSKEVNLFIKNNLSKVMQLIGNDQLQQITNAQLFNDLEEYSKQKNLQKDFVLRKLEKLLHYLLFKECNNRSKVQVQNVQLQIKCSLNYTCPICIKQGDHDGPKSLKNIDNQVHNTENFDSRQSKTMRQITQNEAKENSFTARNIKVEKLLFLKRKESEKTAQVQSLKKQWNVFGSLMGLQKLKYLRQTQLQSKQFKTERLYKELYMRNLHNQRAIKYFIKKGPNLEEKRLTSRSLYIQSTLKSHEEENLKSLPMNYFHKKKAHSVGESFRFDSSIQMKRGISDKKKIVLRPLANLHRTVQFDKSLRNQSSNPKQAENQDTLANRKVKFQFDSSGIANKKARVLVHQDYYYLTTNDTLQRQDKKELLLNGFQL